MDLVSYSDSMLLGKICMVIDFLLILFSSQGVDLCQFYELYLYSLWPDNF